MSGRGGAKGMLGRAGDTLDCGPGALRADLYQVSAYLLNDMYFSKRIDLGAYRLSATLRIETSSPCEV